MPIADDPTLRKEGLIFLEPTLSDRPATHVLLVGVGRFDPPKNPEIARLSALASPPVSARLLADWFLDGTRGKPGFRNPRRPLGSLALLLSEETVPAVAEGAEVPEATHANVKAAIKAWVNRARTNPGNASVLLLCSHGQAFQKQTAILFQDYGSDPDSAVAGMAEVEHLVDALASFPPRDKLVLVDCCRLPTELNLVASGSFGTPLLDQRALPHGTLPDQPQVLRSTRLGTAAYGAGAGRPTLFSGAVIEGLKGAAADPSNDWKIDVDELAQAIRKILELWQDDGEEIQRPRFDLEGQADALAQAEETETASLFLALPAGVDLATARVRVTREDDPTTLLTEVTGAMNGEPFLRLSLPDLTRCRLTAMDAGGATIGETVIKSRAPWMSSRLVAGGGPGGVQVTRAKSADVDTKGGALTVNAEWMQGMPQTPVIRVAPVGPDPEPPPPPMAAPGRYVPSAPPTYDDPFDFGDRAVRPQGTHGTHGTLLPTSRRALPPIVAKPGGGPLLLPQGRWTIRASRIGLSDVETIVDVADGDEVTLDLPAPHSGHEWLAAAVMAGVVGQHAYGGPASSNPANVPQPVLLDRDGKPDETALLAFGNADGRLAVFHAQDNVGERFVQGGTQPENQPVWAEFSGPGWRERCFVPVQGAVAAFAFTRADGQQDPWEAQVLVDTAAPSDSSHIAGYVVSGQWGGLLAFLARRSFIDAGAALRGIASDLPLREAVMGKVSNPLAALAAAQIAVAIAATDEMGIPEPWLVNLANWFPTLPDGPTILGWHLLRQGKADAAQQAFAEAHSRGTPVFSLCVDWLSQGMAATRHADAALARARALVTDPTRAFTVTSLADKDR